MAWRGLANCYQALHGDGGFNIRYLGQITNQNIYIYIASPSSYVNLNRIVHKGCCSTFYSYYRTEAANPRLKGRVMNTISHNLQESQIEEIKMLETLYPRSGRTNTLGFNLTDNNHTDKNNTFHFAHAPYCSVCGDFDLLCENTKY